jgi:hypothetical protein
MKPNRVISTFVIALIASVSFSAFAHNMHARSIVYFDQNNNVIGQRVLYCNGVAHHAGNVGSSDASNPYRVEEDFGCNDPYVTCTTDPSGATACTRTGATENGSLITYFNSAGGYTKEQYCSFHSSSGAFAGHPACGMPAPSELSILQPYVYGWN